MIIDILKVRFKIYLKLKIIRLYINIYKIIYIYICYVILIMLSANLAKNQCWTH